MSGGWKLSAETRKLLTDAHSALAAELDELRGDWSSKSERWQEGDRGTAVDAWLDELAQLADALDSYEDQPEV